MPWTRLDDQFAQHPKMQDAGPLGLAMQVAALCHCNQYLTDGFVSRATAARLQRFDNIDVLDDTEHEHATRMSWELVVDNLVDCGVWNPVEGGWWIHDYEQYQPTREQVLAEREAARKRQSKLRMSRRESRVNNKEVQGPRTRTTYSSKGTASPQSGDDAVPVDKASAHDALLVQASQVAQTWNGKDSLAFTEALDRLERDHQAQLTFSEREQLWEDAIAPGPPDQQP